jgi:hypothetical protein
VVCVPSAAGDGCDPASSKTYTLTGSGSSAPFDVDLPDGGAYLIAFEDVNQSGTLDAGDLYGAAVDAMGDPLLIDSASTGITVTLTILSPAPSSTPSAAPMGAPGDLLGTWGHTASTTSEIYEFKADGTFTYGGVITSRNGVICLTVQLHKDGAFSVMGNQISFTPRVATKASNASCSNMIVTPLPDDTSPFAELWRTASDPNTGVMTLYLTDLRSNIELGYTRQ